MDFQKIEANELLKNAFRDFVHDFSEDKSIDIKEYKLEETQHEIIYAICSNENNT